MPTRRTVVLSITCLGLVLLSAAAYRTPRTAREEPVGPDVEAQARLAGILVADDGSSADPRLSSWTPYPDIDVMALDVRSGRGADLEDVELALARGSEGEVRGFPGAAPARFWLVLVHGAEGIALARARGMTSGAARSVQGGTRSSTCRVL